MGLKLFFKYNIFFAFMFKLKYHIYMKENKRLIDKKIKKTFKIALCLTICLVLGIPAIIFGAINSAWWLLVLGIIATVVGFYGSPIVWVSFGEKKRALRVVDCVTKEHLLSIKEIAMQLQWNEKDTKVIVQKSIVNGYIEGYIFDGEKLTINDRKIQTKKRIQNKCSACGATLDKTEKGYYCPYCGAIFEEK